jgi:hypothetical protein
MGGYTNYNYKPCCPTLNPIVNLTNPSIVNVLQSDGNKYVFNNLTTYDPNTIYGLEFGTYVLKNVPESHPIALLNNGKTNLITYTGNGIGMPFKVDDVSYNFYYGDITIQVYGNFDKISIYCLAHGYMGGENLFVYTKNITPIKTIKSTSTFSESQKLLKLTSCYTCRYDPPSEIQYGNKHDSYNRVLRRRRGQALNQKII